MKRGRVKRPFLYTKFSELKQESDMKRLHIVAAIILNSEKNKIFITKRHKDAHQGGFWEFPGGKIELDETAENAMIRELFEEIGIEVTAQSLFEHLEYDYPDKSLSFDFYTVTGFKNDPYGKEGQQGEWVEIELLEDYAFPEANMSILKKVMKQYG